MGVKRKSGHVPQIGGEVAVYLVGGILDLNSTCYGSVCILYAC